MKPTIAVIGASAHRHKFGNKCVRAYLRAGYQVFPVNPTETEIEGLKTYPSVNDVPIAELDRISVYLPPAISRDVLDDIARKPAREVWFNPGADAPDIVARARGLGMNVITGCSIVDVGISPSDLE